MRVLFVYKFDYFCNTLPCQFNEYSSIINFNHYVQRTS